MTSDLIVTILTRLIIESMITDDITQAAVTSLTGTLAS